MVSGVAQIKVGDKVIESYTSVGLSPEEAKAKDAAFKKTVIECGA